MAAAIATIAAVSCTQELDKVEAVEDAPVFTAYTDGADVTKTVKVGNQSLWQSGDRIWVLNAKEGDYGWKKGYSTTDNETVKATFVQEDDSYSLEGETFFAVYPAVAADNATWEGADILGVSLPVNQNAVAGSYDPAAHLAVAQTTTNSLSFKNAVSLLKFKVKNEGVKSVTIHTNGNGLITGLCSISADGNVTPWTGENEANTWVELSAGEGTFDPAQDYYIAVFPGTLQAGFGVQFSFGGSDKLNVKSYDKELELERNGVLNLGELEYVKPEAEEFVAQDGYVYLSPSDEWKSANARFAAYFFGNGETWEDLALVEGTDNIYGCEIPEGFTKVIFCRMNPGGDTNSWDKDVMWTQTANLKLTEGRVYTVEGWNSGSWSGEPAVEATDEPAEIKLYLKPNSNWTQANARFAAYFFGDGETWLDMTGPDGDGLYEVVVPTDKDYTGLIFCRMNPDTKENKWDNKWNQTANLTIPTDGKNLYTVKDGWWDASDDNQWSTK